MEKKEEAVKCGLCGNADAFAMCSKCGRQTCVDCICYDIKQSGCCFIYPEYTCKECVGIAEPSRKKESG